MGLIPFGVIEQALRIVALVLEGQPLELRAANAIGWFYSTRWLWWASVPKEGQEAITGLLESLVPPKPPGG